MDKLFIVAKWDKKLCLDKIRIAFSPFMLIPLVVPWIETPIHKLGAAPHVLQSTFPITLKIVGICDVKEITILNTLDPSKIMGFLFSKMELLLNKCIEIFILIVRRK